MRLAIGIATRGRPAILAETIAELGRQTRPADEILVCHVAPEDVRNLPLRRPDICFLRTAAGLPRQRNALLEATTAEVLLFLDDDFFPAPSYLEVLEQVLAARADCVVATGTVIADGAKGPGITPEEARTILAVDRPPVDLLLAAPHFNGYGCNMAVRMEVVRRTGIRVDERLPLYAWYEDIDFTRALGRYGAILRLGGARGVHLGVKQARSPGLRLGYSQVINPVYLARKGTFPWSHAIPSVARHLAINAGRSLVPEPHVDRFGRLKGNLLALFDLARGRVEPERALAL